MYPTDAPLVSSCPTPVLESRHSPTPVAALVARLSVHSASNAQKLIFLSGGVVHADIPLINAIVFNRSDDKVVARSRLILIRIEIHESLGDWVDSVRRDHVSWERQTGLWIVDDGSEGSEKFPVRSAINGTLDCQTSGLRMLVPW